MSNRKVNEFLLILGLSLVIVSILFITTDILDYEHPSFSIDFWDHHNYIQMAQGKIFAFSIAPFSWRITAPLIARVLPFGLQNNFLILTCLSIIATGVMMFYFLKKFGFTKDLAFVGFFMFFSLYWATKFLVYDFWLPDPLAFLFVVLLLYCILAKKDLLFIICLAIGVTTKESVIFLAPLYYTLNTDRVIHGRLLWKTIFYVLSAILVLLSFRLFIPASNSYNYVEVFQTVTQERINNFSLDSLYLYSIGTFSVMLLVLPFFALRKNIILFVRFLPFLFLVYLQLFFAYNNERLLIIAFPAMIILALNGIDRIAQWLKIRAIYLSFLPLSYLGLNILSINNVKHHFLIQLLIFSLFLVLIYLIKLFSKKSIT